MDALLADLIQWTRTVSDFLWSWPSIILLVGTGLYLTLRLRFIQFRGFVHAINLIRGKYDQPDDKGEVSHFQALSTALSATIGTGNIAGVATAIAIGGPGAVFWMWITALVGMATKYASCSLAIKFRVVHEDGSISGGPMYTLSRALNLKWLGVLFALFTVIASIGIGNLVQVNSVVDGLNYIIPGASDYGLWIGLAMAVMVALVILGGIQRIAKVASTIVPVMAVIYCGAALWILAVNIEQIPAAFETIFYLAFNTPAVEGAVVGAAIQYGVARGIFSNEAGLGSAAMAHAAARTNEPVREGLVAMLGPFIDTIIICTMTALVIVVSGAWGEARPEEYKGAALSAYAFSQTLGDVGAWVVGFGLMFFAFSTIIAWSYYGDRSAEFLFGKKAIKPYRIVYSLLIIIGATIPLQLVWNITEITNILMAAPNLISLLLLGGLVKKYSDDYFATPQVRQH